MKTNRMFKQMAMTLLMLIAGVNAVMAADWVLFDDKYNAWAHTGYIDLDIFLADLDNSNTYCREGTLIATNNVESIELISLKYINQGDDESQTAEVKAKLLEKNAKAYFTNSQSGDLEIGTTEQSFWLTKWGSDNHYMSAKIKYYYPAELSNKSWHVYFKFKHSDDNWYSKTLASNFYISSAMGLSSYDYYNYEVERTGIDKMTFTIPKMPDDIEPRLSSVRMRKATYYVTYKFYKQDGSLVTVKQEYEASTTEEKKEECTIPAEVGNPKNIICEWKIEYGVKDPEQWFYKRNSYGPRPNFKMVPDPGKITMDYHQFDKKTDITWTNQEERNRTYMAVTPYIYRIETDENGNYKSGSSWSKRGTSKCTGGTVNFTDDDVTTGTYFRYMAVNVPTEWIDKGISSTSLNSPTDDLLVHLGTCISDVVSTEPSVSIYDLRQDTTVTDKVRLNWRYTRVPTDEATVNFKVLRKTANDGDWTEYGSVNADAKPGANTELHFEDSDLPNSSVRYQYKIRLELKSYRFESDAISAGLLSGTSLKAFSATKGTHDGSVTLTWNAKQVGTANSNYVISRRYVNSTSEFMQIYTTNGADANYSYEDRTVKPGYYYEYKIEVYEADVLQNTLYTIGFCQSRGAVSGRVNYGTGNAVADVRLWLRPVDTGDDNVVESSSQYVGGVSHGIYWKADSASVAKIFGGGKEFTVQFFIRPEEGLEQNAVIAVLPGMGQLQIGTPTTDGYNLQWGSTSVGATLPIGTYSLLTLSKSGDQLSIQVDTCEAKTVSVTMQEITVLFSIGGAENSTQAFKGNFSEVRVWDHVLSSTEFDNYADRMLNGREAGLVLYWPLDEGLQRYAFDASYANDLPNGRHATIGANIVPSTIVPGEKQLSRYGLTNADGEYLIRGIPFKGSGSSYTLVPEKGIHEFSPNSRSLFISPTSLTANNIDFEDKSAFPMTGHIYYKGTNIPAEGIQLYIDGTIVTSEGKVCQTDANGYYSISVPIGEHYVEAKLDKVHTMVDGGRFPTTGTYNFVDRVRHDFIDSTFVNFVGRVAGATYNDTLPVGFAASKNNIGVATITLALNNESFSFNCADDYISPATDDRYFESDTTSIRSTAKTGIGAASKYITITTDSATGEFSALLPPLKYVVKSVEIKSNPDISFSPQPEIDLTNPGQTVKDSIRRVSTQGDTITSYYTYNVKKVMTHYAQPQIDVAESKHPAGAYGLDSLIVPIDETQNDTLRKVWSAGTNDTISYMFYYPVYQMGNAVSYDIHGYEAYTNHDGTSPVTDTVPLNSQELTIGNEMSGEQYVIYKVPEDSAHYQPGQIYKMKYNTITLDKTGKATLSWVVGAPNIVKPFTRQFDIKLKRSGRTYQPFRMDAIVLGSLTTGNNFVTKGPDNVQFILRDPYGSHSKTTLKRGHVNTISKYDTYERYGTHKLSATLLGGVELTVGSGMGLMVITGQKVSRNFEAGYSAQWEYTHRYDSIYESTTIETISTGTNYPYIGASGDVYVGTAKNLLIGTCRKVQPKKDATTGKYTITLEDALAIGEEINTIFSYSQYDLEKVMIPKWKDQRKQYLTYVATEDEAKSFVNTGKHAKYLTWLSLDDPHCGDSTTYVFVAPQIQPKETEIDSVAWCNNQIYAWQSYIALNEKAKVEALKNKEPSNYSLDGGVTRTFTFRNDTTAIDQKKTVYKMGAVLGSNIGLQYNGAVAFGTIVNFATDVGGGATTGSGDDNKNYTEWEYTLNEGNRDAELSINMYPAENSSNSKIFSLFGGQTYNPYEIADSTHFYKPNEESLPLGNGSVKMEQPYVQIGANGSLPAKSVTITDIPSGEAATAQLYCTNMTNVNQVVPFSYNVSVYQKTDTTGLQILMDGVPINETAILTEQGTTVQKVITIRQTDQSILDHEGIKIRFSSKYQPTTIYDEVTLNAHFKPSSSPVTLTVTNPVVNTDPTTGNGQLQLKLSGFNRQFKNLKNIGVQYRFAGNTQWTNLFTWVTNPADSTGTSMTRLPATGDLRHTVDMSNNISYPEGEYEFRAFTTTPYDKEQVQVFSDVTKIIKDMTLPQPLYTPSPANGILGIADELAVEFNEDIVPGYVGDKNVIITTKLNGLPINHEVAYNIHPYGDEVRTENPLFLNGNFSLDFWVQLRDTGTIMRQGAENGSFRLSIDKDKHAVLNFAGMEFVSKETLPTEKWIFITLNYQASTMSFNMLAQYDEVSKLLFSKEPIVADSVRVADYADDNYLYLGPVEAYIHDLAIYNIYRDVLEAAAQKYQSKDMYTYGLVNYWPMNEGHGFVAADTRKTHNFSTNDTWLINNTNYALAIDSAAGAQVDISLINATNNDSYAIELWCKADNFNMNNPNARDTIFETEGLRLRFDQDKNVVLDYKDKSQIVANYADFDELSNGYNHYALNVVRGQAASFYLNGQRTAVMAESEMPNFKGATLTLGKGAEGSCVDELRIWKAVLSEDRLLSNRYNAIDTSDVYSRGLIAYYPFEKDSVINGVKTKGETLRNMAPKSPAGNMTAAKYRLLNYTPPIKNAPSEVRLTAIPVASERKVVINLNNTEVTPRELEGTTLNITLAEVHDLHGNTSNPIKWTAYVKQNNLLWLKDSVNINKKYGDAYTFDVNIENLSGQIEYYTITNMPEWLSLVNSEKSDDVQPLKTKTLRFMVNPLVPVDNYDVTIGLKGNNAIVEPLRIVMKVRGEAPQWSVDPTVYDHSMTVIGQVYLSGILMENSESLVAAFIGGECRGVAAPDKIRGAAYVTLSIYGQDTQKKDANKPISFRIWDATKGVAYTDAITLIGNADTTLTFHQDLIVGNYDQPIIWTKSDRVEQLIPVHENWNWIAMGVVPETQYCDLLFSEYEGWGILLKDRTTYIQSNGTEWKGALKPEVNHMYKMKITRTPATVNAVLDPQLSVSGIKLPADSMPVQILPGWNWIPYTPLTTKSVKVALAGLNPQIGDIVKSQTAVSIYSSNGWEGTLASLEPGHGYLYFSTDQQNKSFVYPEGLYTGNEGALGAPLRSLNYQLSSLNYFTPIDEHSYPSNMTMTIRLLDGENVVDTCEIAAFVGDECRGAVRADAEGLYYLVITGEGAGQAMPIRTVLNGEIVTIDDTRTFISDEHIGTPWDPYIIRLNASEDIPSVGAEKQDLKTYKIIEEDHVVIIRNGARYDVTGKKL